jgi:oligopeptidase B
MVVCRSLLLCVLVACSSSAPATSRPTASPIPPASRAVAATPAPAKLVPPVAAKRPHDVTSPNGTRVDPYYWLRDDTRSSAEVLGYLEAENRYAAAVLAPAQRLEDAITAETSAREGTGLAEAPLFEDGYWYYARYEPGKDRPIYARKQGTLDAPEQVVLDANALAGGHTFYSVGRYAVSHDGKLLAWTDDTVGRLQYTLHVKDLATGKLLPDTATAIAPTIEWANDNQTLFYVGKDPTTLREDRVLRHKLGGEHVLVYQEKDGAYYVDLDETKSRKYILIEMDATTLSETRLLDADKPAAPPRVFIPRKADHIYSIDHLGNRFVMRTNDGGENFRIVETSGAHPEQRSTWKELVPHRKDVLVESFAIYAGFLAAQVRVGGLARIEVHAGKKAPFLVEGTDPAFAMTLVDTPDPKATKLRYEYDSLTTPTSTFEQDVHSGARTLLHTEPVPTYDASKYASEYVHATAPDGTQVPVSVVYRKDTPRDGTAPLLVTGYGAYGDSLEPTFERTRVSLLDRGWVFAIAHVRGGQELGYDWYEHGRLLEKQHTFTDFIAATELLVANKYGAKDKVFAEGASAGGLLMGAIANMRPDLYRGIIAWVPFVDAVTTMLDESIPLVTNEYDEWGDPHEKAAYDYMLQYSPYDNVREQKYPALYVRTGLHDSQVQYYEPAKWVAKLRATKTDDNLLVFETDMSAGHAGKSGRFEAVREQARAYAFILYVLVVIR